MEPWLNLRMPVNGLWNSVRCHVERLLHTKWTRGMTRTIAGLDFCYKPQLKRQTLSDLLLALTPF